MLFVIFINDIDLSVVSSPLKFTIYAPVGSLPQTKVRYTHAQDMKQINQSCSCFLKIGLKSAHTFFDDDDF